MLSTGILSAPQIHPGRDAYPGHGCRLPLARERYPWVGVRGQRARTVHQQPALRGERDGVLEKVRGPSPTAKFNVRFGDQVHACKCSVL